MKIGLFGGSFNPPHMGHLLVAEQALMRAKLDQVWWLVSPGNPLKHTMKYPPLQQRIDACQRFCDDPRIKVTGMELIFGTHYTVDTLARLKRVRPRLKFTWLMGADNLRDFHYWKNWKKIASMMPIVVVDRPGSTLSSFSSKAAHYLQNSRKKPHLASAVPIAKPPAWTFIYCMRSSISSTAIRNARQVRSAE